MPAIFTNHDDEGSVASVTGDNFAIGSKPTKKPNGDRTGAYSIDGYVLTLRYDDGRVVRQPFLLGGGGEKTLWFEGALLSFDKDPIGRGCLTDGGLSFVRHPRIGPAGTARG